jgi:hypothetical protein
MSWLVETDILRLSVVFLSLYGRKNGCFVEGGIS